MFVKICGISNLETALIACESGADAVGFVFAQSQRQVSPAQVKKVVAQLPEHVLAVGVFVNEQTNVVDRISSYCGLDIIQLHGAETPQYCRHFHQPLIKSLRVTPDGNILGNENLAEYPVWAFLLDTFVPGHGSGGTGHPFDWAAFKPHKFPKPFLLAGGLNVDNVVTAIQEIQPCGVDVSSGVEARGQKDPDKLRKFIRIAKEVNIHDS